MLDTHIDTLLLDTLKYLYKHWYHEEVGIVACCLVDKDKKAFSTSTKKKGNWKHAERNAYEKFKSLFGSPSSEAIFIVTLSPCIKELKYRQEPSCSELIQELGVKRAHFGILDTLHVDSVDDYREYGIHATVTANQNLSKMCNRLMNMFGTYQSRINTDLLGIKKELGDDFFTEILSVDLSIEH